MRTLTLERGEPGYEGGPRICIHWFHELRGADGRYHQDQRAEICASGLNKFVSGIAKRVRYITIVTSKRETPDCFDIKQDGRLTEVGVMLDCDFRAWLAKSYRQGERFMQVEIGK